ncbi:MAG TPA: glycosyltransferase family 2 protein [Nitrospinota bacterium]|jgi:glycosyltransferase involved in cell wall biosynthesis|nr:glycosyltransferase family 2 protein [Nitrospinota bacterium]|tara:strand:- start:8640 stop:9587 length:948 start_codon:yes stop_codon:yes gene_type:complete
MKLVIQIPCLNEEKTLPLVIRDLPKKIDGVSKIETLIVDDGSTDRTSHVAKELEVGHVIQLSSNHGLAHTFMVGLNGALKLGADIIVNTDGDNQYNGNDIPKLIKPILDNEAEIVIGDREVETIKHFSLTKIFLQKLGSWVVRQLSGTNIPDVTSGFRAYSKEAALQVNVVSKFSYTLETIIMAGKKKIPITHVAVRTNEKLRESRLFKSTWGYLKNSIATIVRIYAMYEPLKVFSYIGGTSFFLGFILGCRYVYFFFIGSTTGHVQSLILSAILIIVGFQIILIGLAADLISINREYVENSLYRIKKSELHLKE